MTDKPKPFAIDSNGSLEHHAHVLLDMLGAIIDQRPCTLTVFDSSRNNPKYRCNISYEPVDVEAT